MRESTFAESNYRFKKGERDNQRRQLFNRNRAFNEVMEEEKPKLESVEEMGYAQAYGAEVREAINRSLQGEIPEELPPLGVTTISLYRRAGRQVFLTRQPGQDKLDPHLAHESLDMLAYCKNPRGFSKYEAVVKQFERQLGQYLGSGWKKVREEAVMAAGNRVIGREEEVVGLVRGDPSGESLWVLINHVCLGKISSRFLLPYLLQRNENAFLAFSYLSQTLRDESITFLADSDEAIDCLVEELSRGGPLQAHALRIVCNMLGENREYWRLFYGSHLLQRACELLQTGSREVRALTLTMIFNFTFEPGAATAVLRHAGLSALLANLLRTESGPLRKELLSIFSFVVYKAQKAEVFQQLVGSELVQICEEVIGNEGQPQVSAMGLQLLCGLLQLGEDFPDEEGGNVVALLVGRSMGLANKVQMELERNTGNNEIYLLCCTILRLLSPSHSEQPL